MAKPLVVYTYAKCSTCRNATAWLKAHGLAFEERPIYTQPPARAELERMLLLQGGDLRKLFNTSGIEYRARNLKEKLPAMGKAEALDLLSGEGRLVRRPFLLCEQTGLLGFREDAWSEALT